MKGFSQRSLDALIDEGKIMIEFIITLLTP